MLRLAIALAILESLLMTPARGMIAPVDQAARELFHEMAGWPIYDPHSHIDPRHPAARNLDEILNYHYYTELAHATGMPVDFVASQLDARTRTENLAGYLERIDNTVQYAWLLEIARTFHGFAYDRLSPQNIGELYDRADHAHDGEVWDRHVWKTSRLEAVFLTNDFDDPLEGWDTEQFVPCLRTDDLVLRLHEPWTVDRLRRASGVDVQDSASLREAVGRIFQRFVSRGARACAVSLPPDFVPRRGTPRRAVTPIRRALHGRNLNSTIGKTLPNRRKVIDLDPEVLDAAAVESLFWREHQLHDSVAQ